MAEQRDASSRLLGGQADARARSGDDNVVALRPMADARQKRPREQRIDMFRGLALAMIFINHVPGTVFEMMTSRNFGFSDATEGFVFISGTSAALAYSEKLRQKRLWPGISRIWGRAWTLYLVHLLITSWVIGISAATMRLGGDPSLFTKDNVEHLFSDMSGVLLGIPVLMHQIGYVNILPMYVVLLFVAPLLIIGAMYRPRLTLVLSGGMWVGVSIWHIDLPNFPTDGGWFLNPFSWQFIFVIGILTGIALKGGARLVPVNTGLTVISVIILVFALVWLKWPGAADYGNARLGEAAAAGVPGILRDFDKTYLAVPRLAHALALIYLLSVIPATRRFAESRWAAPLSVMGRNALPVFALGTILSFAARAAKTLGEASFWLDSLVIAGGLLVLWAFAWTLERARAAAKA